MEGASTYMMGGGGAMEWLENDMSILRMMASQHTHRNIIMIEGISEYCDGDLHTNKLVERQYHSKLGHGGPLSRKTEGIIVSFFYLVW